MESGKYYKIKYAGIKNHELGTEFIDMLKLIYNVADALELTEKSQLDEVKEQIDKFVALTNDFMKLSDEEKKSRK